MYMYLEINFERPALRLAFEKSELDKPCVVSTESAAAYAFYKVLGSRERLWFTVMLTRSIDGKLVGKCDCPAGNGGEYCYHLTAALYTHYDLVESGFCCAITDSIWSPVTEDTIPQYENEDDYFLGLEESILQYEGAANPAPLFLLKKSLRQISYQQFESFNPGRLFDFITHHLEDSAGQANTPSCPYSFPAAT